MTPQRQLKLGVDRARQRIELEMLDGAEAVSSDERGAGAADKWAGVGAEAEAGAGAVAALGWW